MAERRINDDFLRTLRDRNEISEVISSYVNLRRHGSTMKGLCPFHNEKTPSFTVYLDTQSFYCFGCGAGGDVITFIRRIENLGYLDAVRFLAQRVNLPLPEDGYDDGVSNRRRRILAANREAARFFHECLIGPQGRRCLDYLLDRGYTMSTIRHFGLGYAPDGWRALCDHLHQKGFSLPELVDANLARKSEKNDKTNYYDNFRNRAIVPIIDVNGNVVAFGGRVLDDSKPKYINTADTLVYKKGTGVFGLNFAKNSGERRLILTEGYMDTIALHQAGFTNSIACLGTALPDEQVNLVSRYADEVLLSYDSDEAGQKAVQRAITAFSRVGVKVRVLQLSGGKDPDEIIKKYGPERFRAMVDGAANDIEFRLNKARQPFDVSTDDGKIGFMREAVPILASIDSDIERDIYETRLSNDLGISKESIANQVRTARRRRKVGQEREAFRKIQSQSFSSDRSIAVTSNLGAVRAEERLIANLVRDPRLYRQLGVELTEDVFLSDFYKRVFQVLLPYLQAGEQPDITILAQHFTTGEIGRLTGVINTGLVSGNSGAECIECINRLKEEKNKSDVGDVSSFSDEEFSRLFK